MPELTWADDPLKWGDDLLLWGDRLIQFDVAHLTTRFDARAAHRFTTERLGPRFTAGSLEVR